MKKVLTVLAGISIAPLIFSSVAMADSSNPNRIYVPFKDLAIGTCPQILTKIQNYETRFDTNTDAVISNSDNTLNGLVAEAAQLPPGTPGLSDINSDITQAKEAITDYNEESRALAGGLDDYKSLVCSVPQTQQQRVAYLQTLLPRRVQEHHGHLRVEKILNDLQQDITAADPQS